MGLVLFQFEVGKAYDGLKKRKIWIASSWMMGKGRKKWIFLEGLGALNL